MNGKILTPAQIREQAELRLSNFAGNVNDYEGGDPNHYEGGDVNQYIGLDDDGVDFCGGSSFMTEGGSAISYTFTITNAAAGVKQLALVPTYLGTAAALASATGETVDGIITDGTIITDVSGAASNSKLTIAGLQNFIAYNPTRLIRMTVISNTDVGFMGSELVTGEVSPFRAQGTNRIPVTKFVSPDQYNNKKAVIDFRDAGLIDMQLDNQKVLLFSVYGTNTVATTGEVLKFTLEFGAVNNPARTLSKKATRASKTIQAIQVRNASVGRPAFGHQLAFGHKHGARPSNSI